MAGVPAASASPSETVIVTADGLLSPAAAVLEVGGTVLTQYHLIDGVDALIPTAEEPLLAAMPGITVTPDVSVSVQSTTESTGPHTPSDAFLQETGSTRSASGGDTGQGVTVAVLDTGIDNLPDFSGRLVGGVDLTNGSNPYQDSYGHGTFVAGLIAGNGASSNGQYSGEAPGAKLVSVKVAGADGTTHLGTLISGLQWAVDHQSSYGIKILNISLGFQPSQSTVNNPLDQAVEAVWNSGIAVVASAGNAGPFNGTILSPGDDPLVITAGALDDMATQSITDDEMNDFSSVGPTSPDGWVKPDLVTSGRSVVSLAAPGSTIYNNHPSARVGSANFVGSGTSFSAAITSGAAALVLADNPGLTPNQIKARLLGTANPGPVGNPFVDGHGTLNAYAAATSGPMNFSQSAAKLKPTSPGTTVSLSPARPVDTWNPNLWSGASWTPGPPDGWAWNGSAWNGGDW
ncbi:MAG TPA: S8 family peptidase, partial [Candidatus Limnocylindria bacterium]|nr:S8 family peptidase [Candidatus Limnocylindria bacterium]